MRFRYDLGRFKKGKAVAMIGRKAELEILEDCRTADRSQLVVVYGRRRVGKTFLVREAFDYRFTFTHTGLEKGAFREQLAAFWNELRRQCGVQCPVPGNWMEAFEALKDAIAASSDARKTVFLDELPWMDTKNSGFVAAIEAFWNGWASARKDVVLVVCGSAAAWMTKKVLHNRGGLFNRASRTIRLEPFTLRECEEYVQAEGLAMDRKDIASAYMVFGGSPYYWSLLDKRESLSQNIDRLFFGQTAEILRHDLLIPHMPHIRARVGRPVVAADEKRLLKQLFHVFSLLSARFDFHRGSGKARSSAATVL